MELIVLIIYGFALSFILIYSIVQFNLVLNYLRFHKKQKSEVNTEPKLLTDNELPFVTIQLPVYNELYVVERLIDSVVKIDYPHHKLEIQVADDSTDSTLELVAKKVKEYQDKGFDIKHITRKNRIGFKAGALAECLKTAKGEFIAIFDADFLPRQEFIKACLPYFKNDNIGMVQVPWGHINKNYSFLTKLQAFALDAHFTIEQTGRFAGGHFINFNGTAGIWRKKCIIDAGGWQYDTLTEDLDLSYRAQLKGWKFVFNDSIDAPAELPVAMSAIKNQQFRWMKGGAENFVKSAGKVILSHNLPFKTKIHGFMHLMSSSIFVFVFITSLLSIPTLYIKNYFPKYTMIFTISSLFLISLIFLIIFYKVSFHDKSKKPIVKWWHFLIRFVTFLSVSMGLSFHNTIAVIEGYLGKKSSFIRTPKFNILSNSDSWKANKYLSKNLNTITIIEGILVIYFLYGIASAFYLNDFGLLPFHVLLFFGFGTVFFSSVFHLKTTSVPVNENSKK
ncbi:MAG: glycosyltransferase [Chlorobi bacterium]|nr:glycosyltransferase [Chlorobiota bacterium]